ncbi:MAG: zinc-ribbon and DUF3426 domain-containing protein [Pseudomonadota bacterium]|uniref:zinc-ribbon and DUF3426 domain-containing protein n=1 Tax=Thermithiobacillus tepidarius TaxID=929 RepID=UPI0003F5B059|nr:zinc-ribbon and DUF3426 domain-containing protein [Thermithiobacillus tepidarius]
MEIACPRCDTIFAAPANQLRAHLGRVQCGHCELVFEAVPARPAVAARPARRPRYLLLLSLAWLLALGLLLQLLWWTRGYLAAVPGVQPVLVGAADALSLRIPWPQDLNRISIRKTQWVETPHGLAVHGQLYNQAEFVQAMPRLRLLLTGAQGELLRHYAFTPERYLAAPQHARAGLAPRAAVPFRLELPPGSRSSGYQVLLLPN